MTVHRIYNHAVGRCCGLQSGNIAIGGHGHIELSCLMALDVVAIDADGAVLFASLGIFVGIRAGIDSILRVLGLQPFVCL